MSQESHRLYLKLVPLEKKYKYYKKLLENGDTCGVCDGTFPKIVLKYKYGYLKMKYEYDKQCLKDYYFELLTNWWSKEEKDKAMEKINNDIDLNNLKRVIKILKLKLITIGYKEIYL